MDYKKLNAWEQVKFWLGVKGTKETGVIYVDDTREMYLKTIKKMMAKSTFPPEFKDLDINTIELPKTPLEWLELSKVLLGYSDVEAMLDEYYSHKVDRSFFFIGEKETNELLEKEDWGATSLGDILPIIFQKDKYNYFLTNFEVDGTDPKPVYLI